MKRTALAVAALMLGGLAASTSAAIITDNATSGVTEEGRGYEDLPFGASLDVDRSDETHQRGSSSNASLGDRSVSSAGSVDTRGHVTGTAQMGEFRHTSSSAYVQFAFSVTPLPGGMELSMYPVRIHTMGEVSVTSQGMAYGGASASVSIPDVMSHGVGLYAVDNASDAFDQIETLWLSPGTYRGRVEVGGWGSASCAVQEENGPCIPSSVNYQAVADPTFTLDQAAYDAAYPDAPLALDAHFRIDLNPNISWGASPLVAMAPIPEPSVPLLMGGGLALMLVARRSLRSRRAWRPRCPKAA